MDDKADGRIKQADDDEQRMPLLVGIGYEHDARIVSDERAHQDTCREHHGGLTERQRACLIHGSSGREAGGLGEERRDQNGECLARQTGQAFLKGSKRNALMQKQKVCRADGSGHTVHSRCFVRRSARGQASQPAEGIYGRKGRVC